VKRKKAPPRPPRPVWRDQRPPGPTNPDPTTPPEEARLAVGRIVGAHGIRGEVKMDVFSDHPDRLAGIRRVYFNDDPNPRPVRSARFHGRQLLLTFAEINDRDAAEDLRGTTVRVSGSQLPPLEDGAFYHYQLIGLSVYLESGEKLGTLSEIIESGEVDIYVVRERSGREQLFPALKDVVLDIDPAADRVVVRPQVWEDA
jgi:16S rRNA processing protein RimM